MARPKATSDKVKVLKGQKRFVKNVPETRPIKKLWRVPLDLPKSARSLYKEIGDLLVKSEVLTDLDKPLFLQMCRLYAHMQDAEKEIAEYGYVVMDTKGSVKRNPAAAVHKELLNNFVRLAEKFGLSPYDRGKIDLKVDQNPSDEMRKFIFGNK
jgi:P27 family predicted phage terminase small subunit